MYDNLQRRGNSRNICGNYYAYHYTVSGSSLLVHYHTDSYNDYSPTVLAGFIATYQSIGRLCVCVCVGGWVGG